MTNLTLRTLQKINKIYPHSQSHILFMDADTRETMDDVDVESYGYSLTDHLTLSFQGGNSPFGGRTILTQFVYDLETLLCAGWATSTTPASGMEARIDELDFEVEIAIIKDGQKKVVTTWFYDKMNNDMILFLA